MLLDIFGNHLNCKYRNNKDVIKCEQKHFNDLFFI